MEEARGDGGPALAHGRRRWGRLGGGGAGCAGGGGSAGEATAGRRWRTGWLGGGGAAGRHGGGGSAREARRQGDGGPVAAVGGDARGGVRMRGCRGGVWWMRAARSRLDPSDTFFAVCPLFAVCVRAKTHGKDGMCRVFVLCRALSFFHFFPFICFFF